MYMRVVRAQPPAGQADEVARRWAEFWPERLRAQPGFRRAHFGIDRATGAVAGVTVFNEKPDATVLDPLLGEFQATLGASNPAQPPEVTVYEIAAEA